MKQTTDERKVIKLLFKFSVVKKRHNMYLLKQGNPFRLKNYSQHLKRSSNTLNKIEKEIIKLEKRINKL